MNILNWKKECRKEMKDNKLRKIIAEAMYDSKYEALTKGYQDEVDKVVSAIEEIEE